MPSVLIRSLFALAVVSFSISALAQDPPKEEAPAQKPKELKPFDGKMSAEEQVKANNAKRLRKLDDDSLRLKLANSLWNDVELKAGEQGYTWWLKSRVAKGTVQTRSQRWFFGGGQQISDVGSWDVLNGEVIFKSADDRIVARGMIDSEGEIHGQYFNPQRNELFGSFHLIEEYKRPYNVIPFRVIDPNAGK